MSASAAGRPGMTGAVPPAYRIETERLVIRCWAPEDAVALRTELDAHGDHLRPWIPWMRLEPRSLTETAQWLRAMRAQFDRDRDFRYGIFAPDGTLLGETGLYTRVGAGAREIGYWIAARAAGRGLATEATAAMIRVAFEVDGVSRVEIHCSPENLPSAAVPARLGFTHDATLPRRSVDSEGRIEDSMIWSLFADGYAASPAREVPVRAFDCVGRRLL